MMYEYTGFTVWHTRFLHAHEPELVNVILFFYSFQWFSASQDFSPPFSTKAAPGIPPFLSLLTFILIIVFIQRGFSPYTFPTETGVGWSGVGFFGWVGWKGGGGWDPLPWKKKLQNSSLESHLLPRWESLSQSLCLYYLQVLLLLKEVKNLKSFLHW